MSGHIPSMIFPASLMPFSGGIFLSSDNVQEAIDEVVTNMYTALEDYVPYSGATDAVDLGEQALTTTGLGTFGSLEVDGNLEIGGEFNIISDGREGDLTTTEYKASAYGPQWATNKANGSLSSPGEVANGNELGKFTFNGYQNGGFRAAAYITALVNGTPSGSVVPGKLWFYTASTAGPALRMELDASGDLRLLTGNLEIDGDAQKLILGDGNDASIYFDGSDLIIESNDTTANDELLFKSFDRYAFDAVVDLPYLAGIPSPVANGSVWMESDGLHIYYAGAEKVVAGI